MYLIFIKLGAGIYDYMFLAISKAEFMLTNNSFMRGPCTPSVIVFYFVILIHVVYPRKAYLQADATQDCAAVVVARRVDGARPPVWSVDTCTHDQDDKSKGDTQKNRGFIENPNSYGGM